MDVTELYERIQEKLGLPGYEDFDREFDIGGLEGGSLRRKIAEKVHGKLHDYRKILETYLHVDGTDLAILNEIKVLEAEKEEVNAAYKELITAERTYLLVELANTGFEQYIKDAYAAWQKTKPALTHILTLARDSWKNTATIQEDLEYVR